MKHLLVPIIFTSSAVIGTMIDPLPILYRDYKVAATNSRFFSSVVARLIDTCVVHLAVGSLRTVIVSRKWFLLNY